MKHQFKSTSTFTITAPKQKVWDALTNPAIIKQYFFGTNLVADWKVGGMIYFRGEWEGKPYEDKGIITAIIQNELLCYDYKSSWDTSEDIRENYMPIEYRLSESNGITTLEITQGAATQEQAGHSDENWKMVMNGMKELVEKQ
jgi:uncharacterized protein YndB with AHSA1/START domain